MKTLGPVLRDYRQKHHLSVNELSKRTHVPVEFIEALEEEKNDVLPAKTLSRGYVRLIAPEIGLSEESALALFRRDIGEDRVEPTRRRRGRLQITPRLLSLSVLSAAIFLGGAWLLLQWQQLGKPPVLAINTPQNYDIIPTPVQVNGKTDPDAALTINTEVVSTDPQGRFSYQLNLPPGERTIVVLATDRQGRTSEEIVFVTVE